MSAPKVSADRGASVRPVANRTRFKAGTGPGQEWERERIACAGRWNRARKGWEQAQTGSWRARRRTAPVREKRNLFSMGYMQQLYIFSIRLATGASEYPLTKGAIRRLMGATYSQGGVKFPTGGKPQWQARERSFRFITGEGTADPVRFRSRRLQSGWKRIGCPHTGPERN